MSLNSEENKSTPLNTERTQDDKKLGQTPELQFDAVKSAREETCCGAGRLGAYGTMSAVEEALFSKTLTPRTFAKEFGQPYDINDLVTLRVFMQGHGTVLSEPTLWHETALMGVLFWSIFWTVRYFRWEEFNNFLGDESSVRAFVAMFSTLIGLLLSFYTALNLGRWWNMRQCVHTITEACKGLVMMLTATVSKDTSLIEKVQRYPRASLFLIFAAANCADGDDRKPIDAALAQKLLTPEEVLMLGACCSDVMWVQAETLWAWLASAVSRLNDQGLTKGPPHYCMLMGCIEKGRAAVADIQTYLETPIPKGYVHLLCLMVKLHNFILTALMAFACVMHSGEGHSVGMFRTSFRSFFMPFLYNAILILNSQVTDPFGHDPYDFPYWNFDTNIRASAESYLLATKHMPEDFTGKKRFEKVFAKPEEP